MNYKKELEEFFLNYNYMYGGEYNVCKNNN